MYRGRYVHHPEKIRYSGALEKNLLLIAVISSIVISLILLSSNLTGFAITNLTNKTSNMIGGVFFVIGVICCYIWFKKRNKKLTKFNKNIKRVYTKYIGKDILS